MGSMGTVSHFGQPLRVVTGPRSCSCAFEQKGGLCTGVCSEIEMFLPQASAGTGGTISQ